jgi:hypothetical protein
VKVEIGRFMASNGCSSDGIYTFYALIVDVRRSCWVIVVLSFKLIQMTNMRQALP